MHEGEKASSQCLGCKLTQRMDLEQRQKALWRCRKQSTCPAGRFAAAPDLRGIVIRAFTRRYRTLASIGSAALQHVLEARISAHIHGARTLSRSMARFPPH
jgi:hypothetical protein